MTQRYPDGMAPAKKESADPRTATAAVREYLALLDERRTKRKGRRTEAWLRGRIEKIRAQLDAGGVPAIERVALIQERMEIEAELAGGDEGEAAFEAAEQRFIEHAAAWAERKGVSWAALREVGVKPSVLKAAGVKR